MLAVGKISVTVQSHFRSFPRLYRCRIELISSECRADLGLAQCEESFPIISALRCKSYLTILHRHELLARSLLVIWVISANFCTHIHGLFKFHSSILAVGKIPVDVESRFRSFPHPGSGRV